MAEWQPLKVQSVTSATMESSSSKTPPTTESIDFHPDYTENQRSCLLEDSLRNAPISVNKRTLYEACIIASMCCANRIASSFVGLLHEFF